MATEDLAAPGRRGDDSATRLGRRLRPLYLAVFLQGVSLWVPVEKLFMNEIAASTRRASA